MRTKNQTRKCDVPMCDVTVCVPDLSSGNWTHFWGPFPLFPIKNWPLYFAGFWINHTWMLPTISPVPNFSACGTDIPGGWLSVVIWHWAESTMLHRWQGTLHADNIICIWSDEQDGWLEWHENCHPTQTPLTTNPSTTHPHPIWTAAVVTVGSFPSRLARAPLNGGFGGTDARTNQPY